MWVLSQVRWLYEALVPSAVSQFFVVIFWVCPHAGTWHALYQQQLCFTHSCIISKWHLGSRGWGWGTGSIFLSSFWPLDHFDHYVAVRNATLELKKKKHTSGWVILKLFTNSISVHNAGMLERRSKLEGTGSVHNAGMLECWSKKSYMYNKA